MNIRFHSAATQFSFVTPSLVQGIVLFTLGERTFRQIHECSSTQTSMPGNVISPNAYRLTSTRELGQPALHVRIRNALAHSDRVKNFNSILGMSTALIY